MQLSVSYHIMSGLNWVCRAFHAELRSPSSDLKWFCFSWLCPFFLGSCLFSLLLVDLTLRPSFSLLLLPVVRIDHTIVKAHDFTYWTSSSAPRPVLYVTPTHLIVPSQSWQYWEVQIRSVARWFFLWVNLVVYGGYISMYIWMYMESHYSRVGKHFLLRAE